MTHLCGTCSFYRYTEWLQEPRIRFKLFFCLFYKRQIAKYRYDRTYDAEEENYFWDEETIFRNEVEVCRRYDRKIVKLHHYVTGFIESIPYADIGSIL